MSKRKAETETNGQQQNVSRLICLDYIKPSTTNPRKRFDEAAMAELTESVKAKGVLQPVIVRKLFEPSRLARGITVGEFNGRYELVAGERRFRAAQRAGLKEIPAVVLDLDNRSALEIQVIENEQREDVLPSEKAAGYRRLVDEGATAEEIAARVGKSAAAVRGVLLLARMPLPLAEAVDGGTLPRSTAELVCRLPSEGLRERAAAEVLKGHAWSTAPMSCREAKDHLEHNYTVELKGAPFKTADARLAPEAGSCKDCPKRVGNLAREDPEAWQGARADVCTDPGCYRDKVYRQQQKDRQKAQLAGISCLDHGEGERIMPYGAVQGPPWVDLADRCYEFDDDRTWQQALDAIPGEGSCTRWFTHDGKGQPHTLAREKEAVAALRAAGLIADPDAAAEKEPALAKARGAAAEPAPEPKEAGPRRPTPRDISQRAARIAGQVLYEMHAGDYQGTLELPDTAAHRALKLLCLCAAWEMNDDGGATVDLQDKVLSLVDHVGRDDADRSALAAYRSWVDRVEPAQLIAFLMKAFAMRMLTYPESPGSPAARLVLEHGELDWEHLREQAQRELSGGRPAGVNAELPEIDDAENAEEEGALS